VGSLASMVGCLGSGPQPVQKTRVSNPGRVPILGRFFPNFPISRNSFAKAIRWRGFALIEASSGLIGLRLATQGPNQWVATGFSAVGEGFCSSRGKATPVRVRHGGDSVRSC
jgi:hypothetical protein